MNMKRQILILLALVAMVAAKAQKTLVVAQDGSGDYTTIQAAVNAVAEGEEATIQVKAGTYEGIVKIGTRQKASTKKIALIGEGMDTMPRWVSLRQTSMPRTCVFRILAARMQGRRWHFIRTATAPPTIIAR